MRKFATILIILVWAFWCQKQVRAANHHAPLHKTVSVKAKNKPLKEVLWQLTNQTGYYFSYNSERYPPDSACSITYKQQPLIKVLQVLFSDSTAKFTLINNQIAVGSKRSAPAPPFSSTICSGTITSHTTHLPIAHVNITLANRAFGTTTNSEGQFMFKLPPAYLTDTVIFSCIGYKPYRTAASTFKNQHFQLSLSPINISLQEVVIRNTDPLRLITAALNRVAQNYPQHPYRQTCYYREQIKTQNRVKSISEAIIETYKTPQKNTQTDQARLIQGRKSANFSREDTLLVKLKAGIKSVLELDVIKNGIGFLTAEELDLYKYSYNDLVVDNNRLYYQLLFKPVAVLANQIQFEGDILIDANNLSFRRIRFNIPQAYLPQAASFFVFRKNRALKLHVLDAQYEVEYQQIGAKHYPLAVRFTNNFKIKKRRKLRGKKYELTTETAVLLTDTINTKPIPRNQRVKPRTILDEEPAINSNQFWKEYNAIVPEMQLKEILKMSKETAP